MILRVLLTLVVVALPAAASQAATMTFQNGVAGYAGTQDTFLTLDGIRDEVNWGARTHFYVGPYSGEEPDERNRALIRFDVSSLAGLYAEITSITLRLTVLATPGGPNTVDLHQPLAANGDWVEGGSDGAVEAGASSGANKNEPGTPWAGGPGLGSTGFGPLLASAPFTSPSLGVLELTILDSAVATALVDDFLLGANEGFLLKAQDEAFDEGRRDVIFFSSENGVIGERPLLIVDYTPVPEPGNALMLLVGSLVLAALRRRQDASATPASLTSRRGR